MIISLFGCTWLSRIRLFLPLFHALLWLSNLWSLLLCSLITSCFVFFFFWNVEFVLSVFVCSPDGLSIPLNVKEFSANWYATALWYLWP